MHAYTSGLVNTNQKSSAKYSPVKWYNLILLPSTLFPCGEVSIHGAHLGDNYIGTINSVVHGRTSVSGGCRGAHNSSLRGSQVLIISVFVLEEDYVTFWTSDHILPVWYGTYIVSVCGVDWVSDDMSTEDEHDKLNLI